MGSSDLQIWNNAAFDTGEFENTRKKSFFLPDSSSRKENRSPISVNTPATEKKILQKPTGNSFLIAEIRDEKKIDSEMEEIKKEITRLNSKLEALRLEKAEIKIKALEKLGRMVPAKFKEQKQSGGFRRGVSLGPAEIYSASKTRQMGKQETVLTPVNRRKSCFFKLSDVDEEKSSITVDSKPKRKNPVQRQAVTTVGLKKEGSRIMGMSTSSSSSSSSSIQPKKLFQSSKVMPGRIVASRYNQSSSVSKSAIKKRAFPENHDENMMMKNTGNSGGGVKGIRKKRWEIPNEIVIQGNGFDEVSPRVIVMPKRIRTVRIGEVETPRDSGPAKRAVDLVGRKSFFCDEEGDGLSVPKTLNFGDEEEEEVMRT